VSDNVLKAPGKLTLTSLELSSGNTFMGMPRAAVVGLLKDRNQRISVDFTLQGRLDDPAFSLNEGFSTRVATSVAESLGVSLGGLVRGVGSAGSSVVKGVGEAVGKAVRKLKLLRSGCVLRCVPVTLQPHAQFLQFAAHARHDVGRQTRLHRHFDVHRSARVPADPARYRSVVFQAPVHLPGCARA
jgi:hypothetical protein